ncbi:hypothetical protein BJV74DRAFT_828107 [Russula compacta]|nr:hypothetical protein BJV74DRAFT_828107 [Russula compacta]
MSEERVKEVLSNHISNMSNLAYLHSNARHLKKYDAMISDARHSVQVATHELICELPGVEFDGHCADPSSFGLALESLLNPASLFILPGRCNEGFLSMFPHLQEILEGRKSERYEEVLKNLRSFPLVKGLHWRGKVVQRQLWRLQDICSGGGLGFTVEIFLIALRHLLSTSSLKESQSALYTSTFRTITSDWSKYKHSLGTQNILLYAIASPSGLISKFNYPAYITDELLVFIGNMLEGETGPHIDLAIQQLSTDRRYRPEDYDGPPGFPAKALEVISLSRPSVPSSTYPPHLGI